jgi:hypothetical protein
MQGIEGNDEIEFVPVRQPTSVRHFEAKIGLRRRTKVARCKGDHVYRRINADDRAA